MQFAAILNKEGGTLRTRDLDALCELLRSQFAANGHGMDCLVVSGKEMNQALEHAAARDDIDALLVGGGDGTISSAATVAFRTGTPLAILPAGTMNMFARALKLPLDLDLAVAALAAGQSVPVDIATADGEPFVHQFGVGIHARLVRIRETLTYRSRVGKIFASVRAVFAAVIRPPDFEVEIHSARGIERRRASGISVSNNPIGEGHLPYAEGFNAGVLGVYVAAPMGPLALARLALSVMGGRWKDNPLMWERELREVVLQFPKRKHSAQAVVDGELIDLPRQVVLRIHPGALNMILPVPAVVDAAA